MNPSDWLLILSISLANNLDNTGVGIAYGAGKIRLPQSVNLWISVITFVLTGCGALFGYRTGLLLSPHVAKLLSAVILCAIGIFVMRTGLVTPSTQTKSSANLLKSVLEDPRHADQDGSRHIDFKEGTLLGIALSINNIGGGVSAGLIHLSVLWTALCSAILSFLVLWLGGLAGQHFASLRGARNAPFVAGFMLIVIGLLQFR